MRLVLILASLIFLGACDNKSNDVTEPEPPKATYSQIKSNHDSMTAGEFSAYLENLPLLVWEGTIKSAEYEAFTGIIMVDGKELNLDLPKDYRTKFNDKIGTTTSFRLNITGVDSAKLDHIFV